MDVTSLSKKKNLLKKKKILKNVKYLFADLSNLHSLKNILMGNYDFVVNLGGNVTS